MSDWSFMNPTMWSISRGDVWHARCHSASIWRILPDAFDLFDNIFQSMTLLACCLNTWPHFCVWGIPIIIPWLSIQIVVRPFIGIKLKVIPVDFSVLLVTILLMGPIIAYILRSEGYMYLPSKLRQSLPLTNLWTACLMGTMESVMYIWLVLRMPLVLVYASHPPILSLL